jgi:hypothetical protein
MWAIIYIGWKWLWLPLLIILGLIISILLWGAIAFAYVKIRHHSGISLTDNLDKEQAAPRLDH